MPYPCPYCGKEGTYRNQLRTHLMGAMVRGGHELSRKEADEIIARIERAGVPASRRLESSPTGTTVRRPGRASTFQGQADASAGAAITDGHRRILAMLQDLDAMKQTLSLYHAHLGKNGVYLRLTDRGFTVISLDHEHCASMIGVGDRDSGDENLAAIPPTEEQVLSAVEGYRRKRDSLQRSSDEERFALRTIRHALEHGLKLPGKDWYFIHQEWRMPTALGGGKLDLLAVEPEAKRLVVVELKGSKAKTTARDKHGRNAQQQAEHYAEVLWQRKEETYPFFDDLARAMALVHGGPDSMHALELDRNMNPMTAVWWP